MWPPLVLFTNSSKSSGYTVKFHFFVPWNVVMQLALDTYEQNWHVSLFHSFKGLCGALFICHSDQQHSRDGWLMRTSAWSQREWPYNVVSYPTSLVLRNNLFLPNFWDVESILDPSIFFNSTVKTSNPVKTAPQIFVTFFHNSHYQRLHSGPHHFSSEVLLQWLLTTLLPISTP